MQKILTIVILLLANFVFSQETNSIKIELKDNHYSRYSSVAITNDEKYVITSDDSGKILLFNTSNFGYEKTIKAATGIPINGMRLVKNDSILMLSQKYDYPTDGTTDSLIMISLHNNRVLLKEQRKFTFLGNTKSDVIISNTSDNYESVIELFERNFKKITKFKTDKDVKIVEISTNKKKVIYSEGNLVFQNKIIIRDVATNTIEKEFTIDEKVTIVHLYFDENAESFYAIGYLESEKKIAVYKGKDEINWNKPIYSMPFGNYYRDNIISDVIINNEHNIMFTSKSWYVEKPMLLKSNGDQFSVSTIDMEKSSSLSLQIPSKNEIIFFQNFNPNMSDVASFYVFDNVQKKVVNEYPKITTGFYSGTFLPNDNWMTIDHSEKIKFYTAGTFNNRFGKLSVKDYLLLNHNMNNYSFKLFVDRNSGNYIFRGTKKDAEYSNISTYYKFDIVNDKVTKIADDSENLGHILDYNINDNTFLLSEDEYSNLYNSANGYKIKCIKNGESKEIKGIYKAAKLSNDGTLIVSINDKNLIEIRESKNNKIVFTQQLDEGNYTVLSLGETGFIVSAEYKKWLVSNCNKQTIIFNKENGVIQSNTKECMFVNDAIYTNNKVAMIINEEAIVSGEKVLAFTAKEFPQMISYNQDATKLMVSFKNGSIIIYDGATLTPLATMIHPGNDSHIFFDSKGNYFSNIDAEEYLLITKNKQKVTVKSIENSAFNPEKILAIFGKPNEEYLKSLGKALEIRNEYKTKNTIETKVITSKVENENLGKPNLYLVSIGVSKYKQSNYNLTFADKDAKDVFQLYSQFNTNEITAYKDKFYGNAFNVRGTNDTNSKEIKKYLGSYKSVGEFYALNSKGNYWLEIENNKMNLWEFTTQSCDSITITEKFDFSSTYNRKVFPFSDESGFAILESNNTVLNYNFKNKQTTVKSIKNEVNIEKITPISENEWLIFEQIPSWETSKITLYSYNTETNTKTIKSEINQSKSKDKKGNFSTISFNQNYFIANFKSISSNGKYLLYTIDDVLYITDISEKNPTSEKILLDIKIEYNDEVSVSNDGKTFCVLNSNNKDIRYITNVFTIDGKNVANQNFIDKEFLIKGFSIYNAQPKHVEMTNGLLTDGLFEINNIDILNDAKPFSFEKVYATHLTDQMATSQAIKETLNTFFKNTKKNDQIIVFLAGHGVLDTKNQYYFAPHDMDFNNVATNGLSFDFIVNSLKNSNSNNKLLLMDSCHSGNTFDEAEGTKNSSEENKNKEQRGSIGTSTTKNSGFKVSEIVSTLFDDFLSNSGVTILSASSGSDVAYENKSLGNGAFTAAYISLIKGKFNSDFKTLGLKSGTLKTDDLKMSIPLTKEYISEFFKNVMTLTDNKQVPDLREINDLTNIKIW